MVKIVSLIILFHCALLSCSPITGFWQSVDDEYYKVKFDNDFMIEIYKTDTLLNVRYNRSDHSCDKEYMDTSHKADFILLDDEVNTCYEITGISDTVLAYRHTASGKLLVFKKIK